MSFEDPLINFSLDELMQMFSDINILLVESKLNEDESMVVARQSTLEQIQQAIVIKRAEEKPLR